MRVTKKDLQLADALTTVQKQRLELDGLHAKANLLAQQLEATERELLLTREECDVAQLRVDASGPELNYWQAEAEELRRQLTRRELVQPRLRR